MLDLITALGLGTAFGFGFGLATALEAAGFFIKAQCAAGFFIEGLLAGDFTLEGLFTSLSCGESTSAALLSTAQKLGDVNMDPGKPAAEVSQT